MKVEKKSIKKKKSITYYLFFLKEGARFSLKGVPPPNIFRIFMVFDWFG